MKIVGFFHGLLHKGKIILKANDNKDNIAINKLFNSKESREARSGKEILLRVEIDAEFQRRSFSQNNAVWKLVTVIFESEEGRKPTNDEKYDLYLDLLDLYATKRPSRYTGNLINVHISKSNTVEAAYLIEGLLLHIVSQCSLDVDLQATVRSVLYDWQTWRGRQEHDINDDRSIEDLMSKVIYSEASGRTPAEFHHIVTRGASAQLIDKAWNLLALTRDEHNFVHDAGWESFLRKYPHLKGRVNKAFKKAHDYLKGERNV